MEEAVEGGREGGEEAVEDLGEGGGEAGGEVFRTTEGCLARLVVQVGLRFEQIACQSSQSGMIPCSQKKKSQEYHAH